MVDINLFDDEEEKEGKREKDWDSVAPKQEGKRGESFKDELNLDDDLGGPASLGDQALLGDEEVVPELEETGAPGADGNYSFGTDSKKKKTPVYTYIVLVLAIVLLMAVIYFGVFSKKGITFKPIKQVKKPSLTYQSPNLKQLDSKDNQKTGVPVAGFTAGSMDVAKSICDDLTKQGQFGAVLLDGDRFYVEYVSILPGISPQIGKRMMVLLGIKEYKASPEERHVLDGKNTYWGVISGLCQKKPPTMTKTAAALWKSPDLFIDQVKTIAKQNNLPVIDVKKQSRTGTSNGREERFRMRVQCSRTQMISWLDQLKKIQPPYTVNTLFLVSTDYFDQKTNNVKLVLDVSINIG
jgi:hypothetical protein